MGCNCNNSEPFTFKTKETELNYSSGIYSINAGESIHTPIADELKIKQRLTICESCEKKQIIMEKDRCVAGTPMFIKAKTSLQDESCPLKKW